MAHHKDLTGVDLHEPKGAASAASGSVYIANGSGSGVWTALSPSLFTVTRTIPDVSTAGDVYIGIPATGTITEIVGILEAAISGSDSNVSFEINGVTITGSGIVVTESGSAPGNEFDVAPTGNNTVALGDVVKITTDGASTGTAPFTVTLLIDVG